MTDDLVKRLREGDEFERFMLAERAADRIEELTATNEQLSNCVAVLEADLRKMTLDYLAAQGQASENFQMYVDANEARIDAETSLAKVVEALEHLEKQSSATSARGAVTGPHWMKLSIAILTARAALAELKGEK